MDLTPHIPQQLQPISQTNIGPPQAVSSRRLALAVIEQAVADAMSRARGLRDPAIRYLTTPSRGLEFWADIAGLDEESLLRLGHVLARRSAESERSAA